MLTNRFRGSGIPLALFLRHTLHVPPPDAAMRALTVGEGEEDEEGEKEDSDRGEEEDQADHPGSVPGYYELW